jgi:NAD(P)-dependent dehydrogenase (short-subunit alcohol dehydrogenase family)
MTMDTSRGIGKGIAKRFADEGANLVLAANEPGVDALPEELRASGTNALSYVCDVTNKAEVDACMIMPCPSLAKSTSRFRTPA